MVDGVATEPFSATTLPPISTITDSAEKVISVTRERYAEHRSVIEQKVLKWSGMESGDAPAASVSVEPSGPVTVVEPRPGFQYPAIKTEEEQEADAALVASGEAENGSASGGEYLRFSAERLATFVKSAPAQKKDKPKFKHTCSRCGKVWEMPIQLDPTRPMYCAECLPLIRDEKKVKGKVMKAAVTGEAPEGMTLEEVSNETRGEGLEEAMRDVEEGRTIRTGSKQKNPEPNRPRIIVTNSDMYADVIAGDDGDEERSELLDAIADRRGSPVDTRKQTVIPSSVGSLTPRPASPHGVGQYDHAQKSGGGGLGRRQQRSRDGRPLGDRRPHSSVDAERGRSSFSASHPSQRRDEWTNRPAPSQRDSSHHPQRAETTPRPHLPVERPSFHPSPAQRTPQRIQQPSPSSTRERNGSEEGSEDNGTIGDVPRVAFKAPAQHQPQGVSPAPSHAVRPGERIKF
jgi:CxxC-x17-CxxC domain-containing protein